jgi:hypothetical protein
MKKRCKKLVLAKETVRNLKTGDLEAAGGGPAGSVEASSCGVQLCNDACPGAVTSGGLFCA